VLRFVAGIAIKYYARNAIKMSYERVRDESVDSPAPDPITTGRDLSPFGREEVINPAAINLTEIRPRLLIAEHHSTRRKPLGELL